VTIEELEPLTGPLLRPAPGSADVPEGTAAIAPGMLAQHYAPRTPVEIVLRWSDPAPDGSVAALGFRGVPEEGRFLAAESLSPTGDLTEAAAGFFAALRRLDALGASKILVESFPEYGLGVALNDRLRRAAAR
jgi:L-threonylcarbamoyladenylate synthase